MSAKVKGPLFFSGPLFLLEAICNLSYSPAMKPLILISNDDGVHSDGIAALAGALKKIGRVIVVAPDQQRSAASHSITLHRPLRVQRVKRDVYAIDGTPTDCVMLAVHQILKRKPDLIVSGINHGANLGDDVHYSGTVSVAIEGGILGIPSMSVSLVVNGKGHFQMAADYSTKIAMKILKERLPKGIMLNVNIPDVTPGKIKGIVFTRQGKRSYGDIIVEKVDPRGKKYYWIGGDMANYEDIKSSDCNAVLAGYISITPLRVDLTDYVALKSLSKWRF